MKTVIAVIIAILFLILPVRAEFDSIPDNTILLSSADAVVFVDTFAVALTDDGVAVFQWDFAEEQFIYQQRIFLDLGEATIRRVDSVLVISNDDGRMHFVGLSHLPDIPYLGSIDLQMPFADFAISGHDLYVSMWFDGVWRYHLENYSTAVFADSSMKGILVTQLDVQNDTLYVLDEYNGVLRYDLSVDGFGNFLDYLYVPLVVTSFMRNDDRWYLFLGSGNIYVGQFSDSGNAVIDSILDIPIIDRALGDGSHLVFMTSRIAYLVDTGDYDTSVAIDISDNRTTGDIFTGDGRSLLGLPELTGGITMINLDDTSEVFEGLYRSSTVAAMKIIRDRLFVGMYGSPLGVYTIGDSTAVDFDYEIYPSLGNGGPMDSNGDTLIAMFSSINRIGIISKAAVPESLAVNNVFYADSRGALQVQYVPEMVARAQGILVRRSSTVDIFFIPDSAGYVDFGATWSFAKATIQTITVIDSVLYVGTSMKQVQVYRIKPDYSLELLTYIGIGDYATKTILDGSRLFLFVSSTLYIVDVSIPEAPVIRQVLSVPLPVTDAVFSGDTLYAVGPEGITVFNTAPTIPEVIEFGGIGGSFLAVGGGVIAVSDGNGINLYSWNAGEPTVLETPDDILLPDRFRLEQNYPNPFNPQTVITFALPSRSDVNLSVFNLLGQTVKTLVSGILPAGQHAVVWDGTNQAGQRVASGIYFYRLIADQNVARRKMLLLK